MLASPTVRSENFRRRRIVAGTDKDCRIEAGLYLTVQAQCSLQTSWNRRRPRASCVTDRHGLPFGAFTVGHGHLNADRNLDATSPSSSRSNPDLLPGTNRNLQNPTIQTCRTVADLDTE